MLQQWTTVTAEIAPEILQTKRKPHLLFHVADCVRVFGPLILYSTGVHEQENGDVCRIIQRTSRQNTSNDVLHQKVFEMAFDQISSGNYMNVVDSDGDIIQYFRGQEHLINSSHELNSLEVPFTFLSPIGTSRNNQKNGRYMSPDVSYVCTGIVAVNIIITLNEMHVSGV
jgi:hypothetical protein